MEFDRNYVYTALNADGLSVGDKVIVSDTIHDLKERVKNDEPPLELIEIFDDDNEARFMAEEHIANLAYLIERKDNCTNCAHLVDKGSGWTDCELSSEHKYRQKDCLKCKMCIHHKPLNDFKERAKEFKDKLYALEKEYEISLVCGYSQPYDDENSIMLSDNKTHDYMKIWELDEEEDD